MKKIVIVTLLITSLCFGGDTVKKELNTVKGRMMWLRVEHQMLQDLQLRLQQIEDGELNHVDSEKIKLVVEEYTLLRTSKDRKAVRSLHKKLRNIGASGWRKMNK